MGARSEGRVPVMISPPLKSQAQQTYGANQCIASSQHTQRLNPLELGGSNLARGGWGQDRERGGRGGFRDWNRRERGQLQKSRTATMDNLRNVRSEGMWMVR